MTIRSQCPGCWRLDHETIKTKQGCQKTAHTGWPRPAPFCPRGAQDRACLRHSDLLLAGRQNRGRETLSIMKTRQPFPDDAALAKDVLRPQNATLKPGNCGQLWKTSSR